MNDDDLGRAIEQSAARRVRTLQPRPNVDELFARLDARAVRQRRILVATGAVVLVVGVLAGFAIGRSADDGKAPTAVAALDDGVPPRSNAHPQVEPADVEAARAAIAAAYNSAFAGGVPEREKELATQDGENLRALSQEARERALQFGYTPAQLAGTTISLLNTMFIDETHAVVHFTLAVPGHGPILTDRVGYAVFIDGQWRVALRTACDLLSLGGLGRTCPPA